MILPLRIATLALLAFTVAATAAPESPEPLLPLALRGANPAMLSGGTFAFFDARGAFGQLPPPARTAASYANLAKGRPTAVLDARVGVNIRLGDDPDALPPELRGQAEPHLVRSAVNPEVLLACFQEGRFTAVGGAMNCGYSVSRDGGLTWSRSLIPKLAQTSGGPYFRATDPVAGAGPQGELYLNNLVALDSAFALGAVVLSRSTDNGATWSDPVEVYRSTNAQTFPDKNWFAVNDYAGTLNAGRIVVTWTAFTSTPTGVATGNHLVAAFSDDQGRTWSAPVPITPPGSQNQGSQPVFLPDGSLVVVYITFNPNDATQFSVQCKRSVDGGCTFPATSTTIVAAVQGWDDPQLRDGVFLPSVTAARIYGEVMVTYAAVVNGSPRVMFTKSSDQGASWSPPIAASDQPSGVSVMNPAVAASPDGRTVTLVFMDKRLAPDGRNFVDQFAALSFDGGATWRPNIRLTDISSDIRYGPLTSRGVMLGDYFGVVPALIPDQPCVTIWCDTRTGDSDPFVTRFVARATAEFNDWAVAHFNRAELADQQRTAENADFDGDGYSNWFEFGAATNPRVRESGEAVYIAPTATAVTGAWLARANLTYPSFILGLHLGTGASVGFGQGISTPGPLPAPAGMTWQSGRYPLLTAPVRLGPDARSYIDAAFNTDSRLINVATRGRVGRDAAQLIAGFVLEGNKPMLIRAAGPALGALGVANTLADPRLRLEAPASDIFLSNDDWQQPSSFAASSALFARLGAFAFAANSADAALTLPLGPQAYSAIVSGANDSSGIALVEAYDGGTPPGAPGNPRLLNLSTRGDVGTGDNALIAGFVLAGTHPRRVLVRAIGPSLSNFGVNGVLADPVLTLYRNSVLLATNDDWEISRSGPAIAATAQRIGAFALQPASLDAALLITLEPGAYSAIVTGAGNTTGITLVEVYDAN